MSEERQRRADAWTLIEWLRRLGGDDEREAKTPSRAHVMSTLPTARPGGAVLGDTQDEGGGDT